MNRTTRRWSLLLAAVPALAVCFYVVLVLTAQPAPQHRYFAAQSMGPEVIAHRGGAALRPENTLEAFSYAAALGADILEMDVRLSADGKLVVIHDATVDRTTDGKAAVNLLTFAQLQSLDAGFRWTSDGGASYPYRGKGIRIPALEEVFARQGSMRMVVEMKPTGKATALALCALLREAGMTQKVLAASFDVETLLAFRLACPEVATAMGAEEARWFVLGAFAFLSAAYSPAAPALLIPVRIGGTTLARPRLIAAARARGLKVQVWTVNEEAQMRELLDIGIDGIMTGRPDRLLALRAAKDPASAKP